MTKQIKAGTTSDSVTRGSGNVFLDLGFAPKDAVQLRVKAELTRQIRQRIKSLGLTQARAGDRLGVGQPEVSKLMAGRFTGFSTERLISLLTTLNVDVDIVLRHRQKGPGVVRVRGGHAA